MVVAEKEALTPPELPIRGAVDGSKSERLSEGSGTMPTPSDEDVASAEEVKPVPVRRPAELNVIGAMVGMLRLSEARVALVKELSDAGITMLAPLVEMLALAGTTRLAPLVEMLETLEITILAPLAVLLGLAGMAKVALPVELLGTPGATTLSPLGLLVASDDVVVLEMVGAALAEPVTPTVLEPLNSGSEKPVDRETVAEAVGGEETAAMLDEVPSMIVETPTMMEKVELEDVVDAVATATELELPTVGKTNDEGSAPAEVPDSRVWGGTAGGDWLASLVCETPATSDELGLELKTGVELGVVDAEDDAAALSGMADEDGVMAIGVVDKELGSVGWMTVDGGPLLEMPTTPEGSS